MATDADCARYVELVQAIRSARGLRPLSSVMPVDDPRPFIKQMEWQLADLEQRTGEGTERD